MTEQSLTKHIQTKHVGHGTTKPPDSDQVQSAEVDKVLYATIIAQLTIILFTLSTDFQESKWQ